jgi:hypothetical protein
MDAFEFSDALQDAARIREVTCAISNRATGTMARDAGFVVFLQTGEEFQVTIVKIPKGE